MRSWLVTLLVGLTVLFGPGGILTSFVAQAAPAHPTSQTPPTLTPMTLDQALANQAAAWGHGNSTQPGLGPQAAGSPSSLSAPPPVPRQVFTPPPGVTGRVTLSATTTTTLTTSDGILSLVIPAGAVQSSDVATAGGSAVLQVTQIAGASGSSTSGHLVLGVYKIELLDAHNTHLPGLAFHRPLTLSFHYPDSWGGLFRDDSVIVQVQSDAAAPNANTTERVRLMPQKAHFTLSNQITLAALPQTGAATATFNSSSPQANWPTVQDFQTDLNSGSLTYSYPITLPPGPGNFLPNLSLNYASSSVNQATNVQSAADWVGEGWSLDPGEITWSIRYWGTSQAVYSWNISGNGISGALLPQNITWNTNFSGYTAPPLQWYTAPESHAKIIEIQCTTTDAAGAQWTHPCWRVWLPSGVMEEFGATSDSVEYFTDSYNTHYTYSWKLDAMVDPHGNQIHFSYAQDIFQFYSTQYVRDASLSVVSYDSPTCQNTSVICPTTGSAPNLWQPLVQVVFNLGVKPTRLTAADSACQSWPSNSGFRCDDDLVNYPNGIPSPLTMSTRVLNSVAVQVRPTTAFAWQTLRAYAFSYEQHSGLSGLIDPVSGQPEYTAGYLDLTAIQEFGTDWTGDATNTGTSWPAMQFSYSGSGRSAMNCLSTSLPCSDSGEVLQEHYVDPVYIGGITSGGAVVCVAWYSTSSCTPALNSESFFQRYLVEADNGMGWQETFTWQEGHMNVNGVPSGSRVSDPFGCAPSAFTSAPCWEADAQHWSRILLASRDAKVQRTTSGGPTITVDERYGYSYTMATVQAQNQWCAPGTCPVVWDWGNVNEGNYLTFYNAEYRGFSQVQVVQQEIDSGGGACTTACTLSVTNHFFITTQGWGVWDQNEVTNTPGVGCKNGVGSPVQYLCPSSPYWASSNMPAGRETETDAYAADGTTLLSRTLNTYTVNCAPTGDPTTPAPGWDSDGKWWSLNPTSSTPTHLLVGEMDPGNPVALCDPRLISTTTAQVDGGSLSTAPTKTVTYSYDTNQSYSSSHDYGNVTVTDTVASDGGSVGGSGNDIVQTTDYTVNDNITTTATSASGTYIVDTPYQKVTRSGSATGTIQALTQDYYDGNTSLTAPPTRGDLTQESVAYSGSGPYNFLTTKDGYDSYGNLVGILQPNGQTGCTVGGVSYSSCAAYDGSSYTSNYDAHIVSITNALGQITYSNFTTAQGFGYGEWLQNVTDPNNAATSYQYDALGRLTGIIKPGEGTGLLTTQYVYTIWCPATGPSIPCSEMDTIQRYDSSTTVTSRTFYDGWGKAVETRTPADGSNDVVSYTVYDAREEATFASRPYYVSAYTGSPGSAAYSAPDSTQLGSSSVYDALGRKTQATDPAGATTNTQYYQGQDAQGLWYEVQQTVDANQHTSQTFTDALGRTRYEELYTGTWPYNTWYTGTGYNYDYQGNVVNISHADGQWITYYYDLAGRKTGMTDPDLGHVTYQLDADGNITQQTDARGQTVYSGYDALDRQLWRNTTNSPTGAYVTYSYDGTVPTGVSCANISPGSNAIGHVTTEQFKSGPGNSFSGSYCYGYDGRGELIGQVDTLAGTTYLPTLYTYNDAGVVTKLTYPTQEYEQYNFSAQERLISITRSARGTTNYLVPSITYNNAAGAAGKPDSYVVGGGGTCSYTNSSVICASLSYDNDFRLTGISDTHPTSTTPITYYSLSLTYDPVGNVTSASAGLPAAGGQSGGQDNQQFCYDALNRLTWAGDTGTNPCTNQSVTGTTLTAATYTASYQYDIANRITQSTLTGAIASNPQGSYTYDSAHYHAVDAIGSNGYEVQYDASGNMTCRTPTSAAVCTSSSQTGAHLTYDVEGRLIQWVSADGATTVKYGYDGEGQRFEMQVVTGSTTTTTTYISNLEEVQVVGGTTTKIVYFYMGGQRVAEDDNTHWYYPLSDQLTSTTVVVDFSGVIAAQLFAPYGQARWASGTMPTSFAFTGQRADSTTGLDYYGARYYDPVAGIFISADTMLPGKGFSPGGLNRYAYVSGNPETLTDPTGHLINRPCLDGEWCGGGPGGPGGTVDGGKCPDGIQSGCKDDGGDPNCFKGCDCPAASLCSPVPPPPSGVQPPARTCDGSQVYANLCSGGNDTGSLFQSFLGMNFSTLTAVGVYGMNALLYLLQQLYDAISNTPFTPPVSLSQMQDYATALEGLAGGYIGGFFGGPIGSGVGILVGIVIGLIANHANVAQGLYDREVNELKQARQNLLSAVSGAMSKVNSWIDRAKATQQWNLTITLTSNITIAGYDQSDFPMLDMVSYDYIVNASFDISVD